MGAAGTEGMSGLFQVSLGEVVVAGEDGHIAFYCDDVFFLL